MTVLMQKSVGDLEGYTNERRMLFSQISMTLLFTSIITIDAMSLRDSKLVYVRRIQNIDIPSFSNNSNDVMNSSTSMYIYGESKQKKRQSNEGIHGDHIKRWNYFKDTRKIYLWTNGIIPYLFGSGFNDVEKRKVWETMNHVRKHSCISFRPRQSSDRDYIEFSRSKTGCMTFIGRLKGRNVVELDSNCIQKRSSLLHQILHVLGFFDQHNTRDREKWIAILWYNIRPDKRMYFEIPKAPTIDIQMPYDYRSVMHLNMYGYSIGGKETMVSKSNSHSGEFGTLNNDFTSNDIYKMKKLYEQECKDRPKYKSNLAIIDEINANFTGIDENSDDNGNVNVDHNNDDKKDDSSGIEHESERTPDEGSKPPDKEEDKKKDEKIVPHMICVFWPVTIEFNKTKNYKRHTLDTLTESEKLFLLNNHERYRKKCPRVGDAHD